MGILHIVQLAADPTLAPTGIGHHWVNTTTKQTWISVGTSSVADWKKVNNDAITPAASAFTDLTDVPSSYTGQSGNAVRVNVGASGLEFYTPVTTDERVKVSSNDTTAKYLEDAIVVSHGTNASTVLAKTTLNDGADEDVQIQFDVSKVDLSAANNTTSDFASKAYADAKVADAINDGTTTIAPSQNAVFDALALKENIANKATDLVSPDNIKYPTTLAVSTDLSNKVSYSDMQKTALAYVSPSGSNTTGDGSFARPYLTIAYAISNTSDGATIFLLPGLYTEATVIIPPGTGSRAFRGFSANATELQNGISHTANASNINFSFDSININSATLDETAATNGFIYFTKCWFSVTRVDNNPNIVFTSTESNVNSATLSGSNNVFNEALVLGAIVCNGGFNVFENCKFVTTLQAQGATTVRMLDCESFGIASFVNGTIVSTNTPVWEVDLSTEYLGGFTGSVTKTILANISTALGFTPEDVANKSTNTSLGTSDTLYPSQNAVKVYSDTAITNHEAAADPHPQYTTDIESIVKALIFG